MLEVIVRSKGYVKINPDKDLTFENANLKNENFSNKKLDFLTSVNSRFENCKFENMKINGLDFGAGQSMSEYIHCSFDGSVFAAKTAGRARLVNCTFRNVNIKEMFCFSTEFINCIFSGKMRKTVFNGSPFKEDQASLGRTRNEFIGNDFSQLDMVDVGFRTGIDLSQQILPHTEDYLYIENPSSVLVKAKQKVAGWNNVKLKREAKITLEIGEELLAGGQKQLFFIKKDENPEIFDLLKECS